MDGGHLRGGYYHSLRRHFDLDFGFGVNRGGRHPAEAQHPGRHGDPALLRPAADALACAVDVDYP